MNDEQFEKVLEQCDCPFKIEIREGVCTPSKAIVVFRANRFYLLTKALVNLAIKLGEIEVFVEMEEGA